MPATKRRIFAQASRMSSANCRQSRPCLPDIDRLALDRGAHARLQGIGGHEVDLDAEAILQEVFEPKKGIERRSLLEVDEDVEIASFGGLVPRGRAEDRDAPDAEVALERREHRAQAVDGDFASHASSIRAPVPLRPPAPPGAAGPGTPRVGAPPPGG